MRGLIEHFLSACRWSAAGLRILFAGEVAARMELAGAAVGLASLWLVGRAALELVLFATIALLALSVEALNTAIEILVDEISPERSEFARRAKDVGSAAVFLALAAAGLYWLAQMIAAAIGH